MAADGVGGLICTSVALSSPTLDLSRTGLAELPQELYNARHVECLYLEGNKLSSIPDDLFRHLPNLRWLDLRNNRLTQLPSSIGTLRHMKALLLEGNFLTSLPAELGRLTGLTGLNLSGNPLTVPPQSVVEQGTKAVLQYLRSLLSPQASESSMSLNSRSPNFMVTNRSPIKRKEIHFRSPISENHHLPACQQHPGLLAFPTSQRMQLRPIESQPRTQLSSNSSHQLQPREQTKRARKVQQMRKPAVSSDRDTEQTDIRTSAAAGLVGPKQMTRAQDKLRTKKTAKEKAEIADEVQKMKDRESLKEWRDETRCLQRQRTLTRITDFSPLNNAPFATESQQDAKEEDNGSETSLNDANKAEARQRALEQQIRDHTLKLQQQRSALIDMPPEEALERARHNLQVAEDHLHELRSNKLEYRFTAFTGDSLDTVLPRRP